MNTISKLALVCALTLFSSHAMYGMENNNNNKKRKNIDKNQDNILNNITLLNFACEDGNKELVEKIVEKNPELLKAKGRHGFTPLHTACWNNKTNIVEFILEQNPKLLPELLNAKDNDDSTPLHRACSRNSIIINIRKLLLFYGADFNVVNKDNKKPLMHSHNDDESTICNYIREVSSKPYSLLQKLYKHNKAFAQQVLTFLMSLKVLHKTKVLIYKVPKPLIFMIIVGINKNSSIGELLAAKNKDEVDQLIKKWTTNDNKNNDNK